MKPTNIRRTLLAALLAGLAAAAGYLAKEWGGVPDGGVEPRRSPAVGEPPKFFGWVPNPEAVAAVKASLPCPEFRATEAFRAESDGPDDVFLWDACRKATGSVLPARDQGSVGACVGFGTTAAVEYLICVQIASGARERFQPLAQEVIYAGSRVEVGGGRVSGDGSVGAWAAKFVHDWGVVPRGAYGSLDLTRYSESQCRRLGAVGLSDDIETLAKLHPVRAVTTVRTWAECKAAIRNGYPVAVCSSQGFTMRRDADGFCSPRGVWMHCMAVVGVRGGPRPGGFLLNSWGERAHTGPGGVGNPPPAGFWADAAVLDRMLGEGDSWAFCSFAGFPARKLDWYAMGSPIVGMPVALPTGVLVKSEHVRRLQPRRAVRAALQGGVAARRAAHRPALANRDGRRAGSVDPIGACVRPITDPGRCVGGGRV